MEIKCPHCGSVLNETQSKQVSPVKMEVDYECSSADCRYTYLGTLTAIRSITAPKNPLPGINLPTE